MEYHKPHILYAINCGEERGIGARRRKTRESQGDLPYKSCLGSVRKDGYEAVSAAKKQYEGR